MALPEPSPDELDGRSLFGEALDEAALAEWFHHEALGYADLVGDTAANRTAALSRYHVLRHLPPRRYGLGLALGPGTAGDYAALGGLADRYVAIEPARVFWQDRLAGAPAEFREPTVRGTIDLPDGSADFAACFGVLHHIPNVSEVLGEVGRVLGSGAPLILREPIGWMGDFRRPRRGLTRHERGIPHGLMDTMLMGAGFSVRRKSFASFPGPRELAWKLGVAYPWQHPAIVRFDAALARLTAWNVRYRRETFWHKLAPRLCYWLALKR